MLDAFHEEHERVFAVKEPEQQIECAYWRGRLTAVLDAPPLRFIWRTLARIRARFNSTSATKTFNTPCVIRSWRLADSKTSRRTNPSDGEELNRRRSPTVSDSTVQRLLHDLGKNRNVRHLAWTIAGHRRDNHATALSFLAHTIQSELFTSMTDQLNGRGTRVAKGAWTNHRPGARFLLASGTQRA